jgi:hypothetical protein
MSKSNSRGRTRRSGLLIVGISVLVLLGAAATFVAIRGWDAVSTIFAGQKKDAHVGKIAVVTSPRPIPAFTPLDPAMFVNPATGDFNVAWVTEKVAQDAYMIRDPAQLRGRVLKRDKGANLSFSEADLFPKGSQPSPTAAIETGYRGLHVSTKDVEGLFGLKRFDRVDLIAVINVRPMGSADEPGIVYSPEAREALQSAKEWKTERRIVAQNAKIIEPIPESARKAGPASDCFLAIREEEVAALTDAIAKGAKITCTARSGLPGGDLSTYTDTEQAPAVDTMEFISGNKRWKTVVPATKNEGDAPPPEPK